LDEKVYLVFKKRSFSKDTLYFPGGGYSIAINPIGYTKVGDFDHFLINPENLLENDTIVISTSSEIVLEHKYHYYYSSIYSFLPGDSVIFDYVNDAPFVSILNREIEKRILNFETYFNLNSKKPMGREEFFLTNKRFRNKEEKKIYYYERTYTLEAKYHKLDSMNKIYFNKTNTFFFAQNFLKFSQPQLFVTNYDKNLRNDSLLSLSTYRNFLKNYSLHTFETPIINTTGKESVYDFRKLFDSVSVDINKYYSLSTKHFLMDETLKSIASNFSVNDFEQYFKKYSTGVRDSLLVQRMANMYLVDFHRLKAEQDVVNLVNRNKEKLTLNTVFEQNKGKIFYVDFWASWCKPCREVMPDSHGLRERFKENDVEFIYISIDKDYEKWLGASKKEDLYKLKNNFLAVNFPSADFFKKLNLTTIPRYMLFDSSGKIIFQDTYAPNSEEIGELINKNL